MFQPSRHQMRFKKKAYKDFKDYDWSDMTPVQIQTLTGNRSVQKWCEDPAFREWFDEGDIVNTELQMGAEDAVRALREVVNSEDVGPDGQFTGANYVSAAVKLLELAGYTPPTHKVVEYKDKDIAGKSDAELQDMITKLQKQLEPKDPTPRLVKDK